MSSSGMIGVASGILAIQFAPKNEVLNGVPIWALALLAVMVAYLVLSWRAAAVSGRNES